MVKLAGKVYSESELSALAKTEINEPDEKRLAKDLQALKDWMQKQPHLAKTARQDDHFLLFMLRGCKFSLEKTKRKIESWNTIRNMCPEIFDGWDVEDPKMRELIQLGITVPMPGYDKHGRGVIVQRFNLADPKRFSPDDLMKVNSLITDFWLEQNNKQVDVCGVVVISDSVGATLSHLTGYTPAWSKKVTTIFEEMYPARPKAMYFLNMPTFVETLYNMIKGFLKKKTQERMIVIPKGDLSAIQKALGLEVLPEEYGGSNGSMKQHIDAQAAAMMGKRKWLMEQTKRKANESKRQGMVKSYSDIFGMEGSFRQLDFD